MNVKEILKHVDHTLLKAFDKNSTTLDYIDVKSGDVILLCSDGLSGLVGSEELLKIYLDSDFNALCDNYIEAANNYGGRDNITVVAVKC